MPFGEVFCCVPGGNTDSGKNIFGHMASQKEMKSLYPSWLTHRAEGNPEWLKDEKRKNEISRAPRGYFHASSSGTMQRFRNERAESRLGGRSQSGVISSR